MNHSNRFALASVLGALVLGPAAVAGQLADRARAIADEIEDREYDFSRRQSAQVSRLLDRLEAAVRRNPRDPRDPRDPGRPGGFHYEADCHVDDDPDFDYYQHVIRDIRARSLGELARKCEDAARMRYRQDYSFGLKNLNTRNIPSRFAHAECEIDDDADFDWGQNVIGKIYGRSVSELARACKNLARGSYGDDGTAGIKDAGWQSTAPSNWARGTCHVDDDTDFDWNQMVIGEVRGLDGLDLERECSDIARTLFGADGSYGVREIR